MTSCLKNSMSSNLEVMSGMFERIDFQTPRRPDLSSSRVLSRWHSGICTMTQERWESLISDRLELTPMSIVPAGERQGLLDLPALCIGCRLEIGPQAISSLIVGSGRLTRALVESVLNIQGEMWPEPVNLSPGEMAILEILFDNISESIGESWPGSEPLLTRVADIISKPNRSRIFTPGTDLLVLRIRVDTRYGDEQIAWLVPKLPVEELIANEFGQATIQQQHSAAAMADHTQRLPAEIIVELGTAEITMNQAYELRLGDVLILNQSVRKPLIACVQGQPKWKVNPVRIGGQLGFQVAEVIVE